MIFQGTRKIIRVRVDAPEQTVCPKRTVKIVKQGQSPETPKQTVPIVKNDVIMSLRDMWTGAVRNNREALTFQDLFKSTEEI